MKVSITDVAQKAGVSTATVSRVMNNASEILDETRKRVLSAAEELGYRPNQQARALRRGTFDTIGFLISPDMGEIEDTGYSSSLWSHLVNASAVEGFPMVHEILSRSADGKIVVPSFVRDKGISGLMVLGYLDKKEFDFIDSWGVPACFLEIQEWMKSSTLAVDFDYKEGIRLAVQYLSAFGHRRIALVHGANEYSDDIGKTEGFRAAVREFGLDSSEELIAKTERLEQNYTGGKKAVEYLLSIDNPPSAVCFFSDWSAVGGIAAALEKGLKIPDDISIVGFDDSYIARQCSPGITSVSLGVEEMARTAIDLLVRAIKNRPIPKSQIEIRPSLITRGSCAPKR